MASVAKNAIKSEWFFIVHHSLLFLIVTSLSAAILIVHSEYSPLFAHSSSPSLGALVVSPMYNR